jgi:regulatory protein
LLALRWRSRVELRRHLLRSGFDLLEVESALEELELAGLVEDGRFAREVVRDQAIRRLAGDRAIRKALREKGVASETIDRAIEEAGDETERATALAEQRATRLANLEPEAAYRRLYGLLIRRGFGPAVAREAARHGLATPPEDTAELD